MGGRIRTHPAAPCAGLASACHQGTPRAIPLEGSNPPGRGVNTPKGPSEEGPSPTLAPVHGWTDSNAPGCAVCRSRFGVPEAPTPRGTSGSALLWRARQAERHASGDPTRRFESSRARGQHTKRALRRGPLPHIGAGPWVDGFERTRLRRVPVSLRRAIKARLGRSHSKVRILPGDGSAHQKGPPKRAPPPHWRRSMGGRIRTHPAAPCAGLASACHQGPPRAIPLEGSNPPGRWVSTPKGPSEEGPSPTLAPVHGWTDSNAPGCAVCRSRFGVPEAPTPRGTSGSALLWRARQAERHASGDPTRRFESSRARGQHTKRALRRGPLWCVGRRERIRTSDPYHPKVVRYQAAPRAVNI